MIEVKVDGEGYGLPLGNDSFVDLLANDVWSEQDITNRTQAMVRTFFPAEEEIIINRDISGMGFGIPLSAAQYGQVVALKTLLLQTRALGAKARADMVLLLDAMKVQAALLRLDADVPEPEFEIRLDGEGEPVETEVVVNQSALDEDEAARAEAQAVVDAATDDAKLLAEVRLGRWLPPVEDEPESEEILGE